MSIFILEDAPDETRLASIYRHGLVRRRQERRRSTNESPGISHDLVLSIPDLDGVGMIAGSKWRRTGVGEVGRIQYFGTRSDCDQLAIDPQSCRGRIHNGCSQIAGPELERVDARIDCGQEKESVATPAGAQR